MEFSGPRSVSHRNGVSQRERQEHKHRCRKPRTVGFSKKTNFTQKYSRGTIFKKMRIENVIPFNFKTYATNSQESIFIIISCQSVVESMMAHLKSVFLCFHKKSMPREPRPIPPNKEAPRRFNMLPCSYPNIIKHSSQNHVLFSSLWTFHLKTFLVLWGGNLFNIYCSLSCTWTVHKPCCSSRQGVATYSSLVEFVF